MDSAFQNILSRFPSKRILVVGDVMLDEYLWGSVRRISQEAPVPVVDLHKRSYVPGGAANTAANLAGLQAEVYLVGVRGDDETGKRLAQSLSESGIHLDGLLVDKDRPTTSKMRIIAHGQQVVRVDHEERDAIAAEVEEQLLEVIAKRLPEVDGCILSDYAKGVMTRKVAQAVIQQANKRGIAVVVDPKGADFARYRGATLIKPNMQEAALSIRLDVASAEQMVVAGQCLLARLNCAGVLITCGAAGMSLFERPDAEPIHIPATAREVYDVTGAGDTVASTMIMAMTAGATLEQAARLASQAAGIIVGRVGTSAVRLQDLTGASSATATGVDKPASPSLSKNQSLPDERREPYRAPVNKIPESWSRTTYWTCNDSSSALVDVSSLESVCLAEQDETCDPSPDMILGSDEN